MNEVAKDIERAQQEAARKVAEAEKLAELAKFYPDLKKRTGRWGKVAYYSLAANEQVTDFDARHNCGCCSDSPLEIWPYVHTPYGNVYSDPPCFTVGERIPYYEEAEREDRAYPNWDKAMTDAKIPDRIIDRVGAHLGVDRTAKATDK